MVPSLAITSVTPHVSTVHTSEPVEAPHTTSASRVNTFTTHEDTGGISNYHAPLPIWVYTSHPSTECTDKGKDCPPTDPAKLKQYNDKNSATAVIVGTLLVAFIAGMVLLLIAA